MRMKLTLPSFFFVPLFIALILTSCGESTSEETQKSILTDEEVVSSDSSTVYQSDHLIIKQLGDHVYQHISFLETDDFGKVECNGMIVVNGNEGVVFDTPTENAASLELLRFVTDVLKTKITAVIPTHFHEDCVGGIEVFAQQKIPIYAGKLTVELSQKNEQAFANTFIAFDRSLALHIGNKKVYAEYIGEGHTKDNIVGYFPESNAVFGGCLIKAYGASKGYLGDASPDKWSETVRKLKLNYPDAEIVIPGHGAPGGTELFDYTIELFDVNE